MTIIEAVLEYLNTITDLTDIVGDRIFVDYAPQETEYPYIVLEMSSERFNPVLTGDTDLAEADIYLHIISNQSRSITTNASEIVRINLFTCLLYTSPSPRDGLLSRMPSSA